MTENPFIEHPATRRELHGGVQYEFKFANGYGASVVRHDYSHGGPSGSWELAVLDSADRLDYSTPVTDDVLGWLSVEDVRAALAQVAELPSQSDAVAS